MTKTSVDTEPSTSIPDAKESDYTATMLASASAGFIMRVPMHPMDTIKAKLQVERSTVRATGSQNHGILSMFSTVMKNEGIRGLYRGFGVTGLGSIPSSLLYFTSYEYSRDKLQEFEFLSNLPALSHLAAGMAAETFSCVLWVPIDVVKERMQIQVKGSSFYYRNSIDAISQIARHEGFRGLYRAYGATVMSFGPFSALYFAFYEKLKAASIHWSGCESEKTLPFRYFLLSGAMAGAAASFSTNPLDIVKLRMQVQRGDTSHRFHFQYRNLPQGLATLVREEGALAMFRGVSARVAFHAPATAIHIASFEELKRFYGTLLLEK